jgi:L-2-hydroxyglutarate oxidase LhgO
VTDLVPLTASEARALEPELRCVAAYLSPSTGIIDSHAFMLALQGDAESGGATVAFRSPATGGAVRDDGVVLDVGGAAPLRVLARSVVNSAGLHAQRLAAALDGFPSAHVPPTYYAKGNYYSLAGRSPFSRLVYPMPNEAGLGVHITLDLAGEARFGPDVEWIDRIDYDVDPRRADRFYAAIREYWPGLADGRLAPGYAGIRPKLAPPNAPAADFVISGPRDHGVAGLVNLFGIESPGLTAALAIADHVRELLAASR